jgi:aminoglycoside phosphotransferase (APT) family kinase protein
LGHEDRTMTEIDRAELTRLVGTEVYAVQPEPVPTGGLHSRVFACRSVAGELILRICEGRQGFYTHYFPERVKWDEWMDQHWAVEAAQAAGVPAPEIVSSDRNRRWVVMKRLPGIPIDGRYETWQGCPYDEREFGLLLYRLHSVIPSGFGPINDSGRALFGTWAEFLVEAARSAIQTCRERAAVSPTLCRQLENIWMPALAETSVEKTSLLHMESLGFSNIMYDPESRRITGLLDYEDCLGGDQLFELVWMRYYFEHEGKDQHYFDFKRFELGYGGIIWDKRRMTLYGPFPYLDKLRWIPHDGDRAKSYTAKLESLLREL